MTAKNDNNRENVCPTEAIADEQTPLIRRRNGMVQEQREESEETSKKVSISQLFRYASAMDRLSFTFGQLLAVLAGVAVPLVSIVIGNVTQEFVNIASVMRNGTAEELDRAFVIFHDRMIVCCLQYAVIGITVFVASALQQSCLLTACENMTARLRREFVRAALRQDIAWFDKTLSGSMASKIFDNLERVKEGTGDKLGLFVQWTAKLIGGFAIAFTYEWRITAIMLCTTPFSMLCLAVFGKLSMQGAAKGAEKYAVAGGIASETLSSIRTVHAFNAQPFEVKRYERALVAGMKDGVKLALYAGAGAGCSNFMYFASACLGYWIGSDYVSWGWIEAGTAITAFNAVIIGTGAVSIISPMYGAVKSAQGYAEGMYAVIDRMPQIDSSGVEEPLNVRGQINFERVKFSYPGRSEVKVLKDITLDCAPGQTVALVGSSGSGKSTVISLLLRYYDPSDGKITLDGIDLKRFNIQFLRRTIGVVSQEPVLFDTTIEENLRFVREDATKEDMYEALRKANAYDFVCELPQGLKTLVGTRGTQLSGGQKQRIAIARALLKNPKILLLDEATSALDAHSEKAVQKALEMASEGRTTFIVAHRLSTIRNADCIFVFKDGVVVEQGKHDELLTSRCHYHALVNSQVFIDLEEGDSNEEVSKSADQLKSKLSHDKGEMEGQLHQTQKENDSERLKKELNEEGVPRAGLFSIINKARPEWPLYCLALVGTMIEAGTFPMFALITTDIINAFSLEDKTEMQNEIHFYCLLFLALGCATGFSVLCNKFFFGLSAERLTMRLRLNAYKRLLGMHIAYMDEPRHSPAKLCTRLATDAPMVKSAIDHRLGAIVDTVISLALCLTLSFYFGWQLALLMLCLLPIAGLGMSINRRYIESHSKRDNKELEEAGMIVTEAMENIRTVHALTLEENVLRRFSDYCEGPIRTAKKNALIQSFTYAFSTSFIFFNNAITFRFALWLIVQGYIAPMHVLKVVYIMAFVPGVLGLASAYYPEYVKATLAAGLIFRILDLQPEINATDGVEDEEINGDLQLKNVKFAYKQRPTVQVLRGIDLTVKKGQTIALVGPSGCGKSTIVSLLERFYDPTDGDVVIDGRSFAERNLPNVRHQMSIVSQEPTLFNLSIRENIGYGVENITDEEIMNSSKMANAHNFIIDMPAGYDTRVGDKGVRLSGGQKQRLAIARALVRKPKILLLDEATSALDMESEKLVQEALDSASKGRTCIVIAHRLATVVKADRILVMDDGRIVEQGTHDELMKARGAYYKLTLQQNRTQPNCLSYFV